MKLTLSLLILALPSLALAAGGHGGGHEEGVPKVVIYQVINLAILFSGIVYFTKGAIVEFFTVRKATYLEASQKAAAARAQAEKDFADIKTKLAELDTNHKTAIAKAQTQAVDIQKQMSAEAQALATRIREEAKLTVNLEVHRAKKELRQQLLQDSMEAARLLVTKDLSAADQQKLQKDFINQVGV
jgi:F-type H+-transporting ATPase subunit b